MVYQLVFKFILPIYHTTRQVRRGFRDMQEQRNGYADGPAFPKPHAAKKKEPAGDYIDFEEVKEK